uniref:Uncharacterized protein n=1 Tax=Anguilla anguilla TaxID=7936 RepID=A0A0E9PP79_ANGAN
MRVPVCVRASVYVKTFSQVGYLRNRREFLIFPSTSLTVFEWTPTVSFPSFQRI